MDYLQKLKENGKLETYKTNNNFMEEEEINLIDYIRVVFKRKKTILVCALIAVCVAFLFYFFSTSVYEIDTILEIGHMENFVPEEPIQVVEKIQNNTYNEIIKEKLNRENTLKGIEASTPEKTRLVKITVKTTNPTQGKLALDTLNQIILKEHQEKFNTQKSIILDSKKRMESKIENLENEKKILEEKVKYFSNLFAAEPSITNQFFLMGSREELEAKKTDIDNAYVELNNFLRQIENYDATKVIKEPVAPSVKSSIDIKAIIIYIIIALVVGIFIGILVCFFQEFWDKNKKQLTRG